jgi:hypothetical protein
VSHARTHARTLARTLVRAGGRADARSHVSTHAQTQARTGAGGMRERACACTRTCGCTNPRIGRRAGVGGERLAFGSVRGCAWDQIRRKVGAGRPREGRATSRRCGGNRSQRVPLQCQARDSTSAMHGGGCARARVCECACVCVCGVELCQRRALSQHGPEVEGRRIAFIDVDQPLAPPLHSTARLRDRTTAPRTASL